MRKEISKSHLENNYEKKIITVVDCFKGEEFQEENKMLNNYLDGLSDEEFMSLLLFQQY